jgi:hypothetical protein
VAVDVKQKRLVCVAIESIDLFKVGRKNTYFTVKNRVSFHVNFFPANTTNFVGKSILNAF